MALSLLFLASLMLTHLPLSRSYRDGARPESCYNMLVIHENQFNPVNPVVPPQDCFNPGPCRFQLNMVGRVTGEDNSTVEESDPTTYQCGEVYQLQLVASGSMTTFEGILVEARENTSSFEEGSTIWGIWASDPNSHYHAVECNRSSTSSEGPFPNAATQDEPSGLSSVDLYWRAPPPPNTTDEYQQLPLEIKFWFVAVQQRLVYYMPVAGPVLTRNCTEPTSPAPTISPSVIAQISTPTTSTAPPIIPTASLPTTSSSTSPPNIPTTSLPTTSSSTTPPTVPTTSSSTSPPNLPTTSLPTSSSSTTPPTVPTTSSSTSPPNIPTTSLPTTSSTPAPPNILGEVEIIALAAGIAGGIIILLLILLIVITAVICCLVAKSRKESDFYDKPAEGTKGIFEMSKKKNKHDIVFQNMHSMPYNDFEPVTGNGDQL